MSDLLHALPVSPKDGELVPGNAVVLEWESRGTTDTHHVQVSESESFDRLLVDAAVGTAHSVQLLGVLPQDGRTLWWRVTSHRDAWSAPASFRSGDRRSSAVAARAQARSATRPLASPQAPTASGDALPLYLRGTTGSGELVGAIVVMAALVLFLIAVLAF